MRFDHRSISHPVHLTIAVGVTRDPRPRVDVALSPVQRSITIIARQGAERKLTKGLVLINSELAFK